MMKSAVAAMLALLLGALCIHAQQNNDSPPPIVLTQPEKDFQDAMTNVTLTGFFTVGDSGEPHDDRYIIEALSKTAPGDVWNIVASIQYNKKDYKATVKVPVKWAGDTPVLMLQNYLIQGQGVFSARILIHNGMYAGTWGNQKQGGKMYGKVVKNEAAPAQPAALPEPPPAAPPKP
jgi:hypothetical protein